MYSNQTSEDPAFALLEGQHATPLSSEPSARGHATDSGGVILYDPMQSSLLATTKNVAVLVPSSAHAAAQAYREEQRQRSITYHSESTQRRGAASSRSTGRRRRADTARDGRYGGGGAIRPGGPVDLFSHAHVGLLIAFLIVGLFDGMARALVYPLFKVYLHLSGYQQQAAGALLGFGWSCKFVFGYLSDCVPIRGQRRKPYAIIALLVLLAFSAGMALMPVIEPYMKPKGVVHNANAPEQAQRYVLLVMCASFGHALLSVACEGLMVEFAQRESESERGRVQGTMYAVRFLGELLATLLVALGYSSEEYGGDFSFSLSINTIMAVLTVVTVAGLYATHSHMTEETIVLGSQPVYTRLRSIWRFAESRAAWQITLVGFVQVFAFLYRVPQEDTIYEQWLHGDTLTKSLFFTLKCAIYALAIYQLRGGALRNASWSMVLFVTIAVSTVVGLVASYLLVENVLRSKIFSLLAAQVVHYCDAFAWMIRILAIVEIAEPGYEASTYALVTTIYNLAIPLSTATASAVSGALAIDDAAIAQDSPSVRSFVLSHYVVMYALRVVGGMGTILLFPRQKRWARLLKQRGNPNAAVPLAVIALFVVVYFATWISVVLAMFQSTACLHIAGGNGCE